MYIFPMDYSTRDKTLPSFPYSFKNPPVRITANVMCHRHSSQASSAGRWTHGQVG